MQLRTALGQLPALNPPHVGAVGAAQVRRQARSAPSTWICVDDGPSLVVSSTAETALNRTTRALRVRITATCCPTARGRRACQISPRKGAGSLSATSGRSAFGIWG